MYFQAATDEQSIKTSLDTNTISEANPGCTVLPTGEVNCTLAVYHDRKTWRLSRNKIDAQIQHLRQQLEELKEIRKHLKKKRPNTFDEFEDDLLPLPITSSTTEKSEKDIFDSFEPNSDSSENYTLTSSTESPRVTDFEGFRNKSRKHKNHNQEERQKEVEFTSQRSTRRRNKYQKTDVSNITSLIDYGLFETNTTSRPVQFTNHHRHHHKIYATSSTTESHFIASSPSTPEYEEASTTETMFETPNRFLNRVSNLCL